MEIAPPPPYIHVQINVIEFINPTPPPPRLLFLLYIFLNKRNNIQ